MGIIGGILKAIILAAIIALVAAVAGALAGMFLCADGACAWAETPTSIMRTPAPVFGGLSMAMVLGALLTLGLVIVLTPSDAVTSLATIFALLIAVVAFFTFIPAVEVIEEEEPEAEPVEAVSETLAVAEPITCGDGSYLEGGACQSCFETRSVPAPARLSFDPVATDAYWEYAKAKTVVLDGRETSLATFAEDLADSSTMCLSTALLVYGSASSDGTRDVNEARAKARAQNLAEAIRDACTGSSDGLKIFALSLGQSEFTTDVPEDRPVSVSMIDSLDGSDPDASLVLEELSYALGEGASFAPILSRRDRFPRPWQGPAGLSATIEARLRPTNRRQVLRAGAPASCRVSDRLGLDEGPSLRQ